MFHDTEADNDAHKVFVPSFEQRVSARRSLAEHPLGCLLLQQERQQEPEEPEEPSPFGM